MQIMQCIEFVITCVATCDFARYRCRDGVIVHVLAVALRAQTRPGSQEIEDKGM